MNEKMYSLHVLRETFGHVKFVSKAEADWHTYRFHSAAADEAKNSF